MNLIREIKEFIKMQIPDDIYLRWQFKRIMGYPLDLKNPKTFNEKLQWLKLYDRKPIYTTMVDKYEAKKYVASIIGEQYIIPTLGVWEGFDDIDFDKLPQQFVLKCTHDSGGVIIVKDKNKLDINAARKKINTSLKRNFYYWGREWPYKNIKPRIIAEKYINTNEIQDTKVLPDYKFQCFAGKVDNILLCTDRDINGHANYYFFDRHWNFLPYSKQVYPHSDLNSLAQYKPKNLNKMIIIAEKLSAGIPELRVDLYEIHNQIYFGELTFFTESGFDRDITREADLSEGSKLILSKK